MTQKLPHQMLLRTFVTVRRDAMKQTIWASCRTAQLVTHFTSLLSTQKVEQHLLALIYQTFLALVKEL